MPEFHLQHGRLQTVEAGVHAELLVVVLHGGAVVGDPPRPCRQFIVVGEERAAVAEAAEVFRGEEGGTAEVAHRARAPPLPVTERILRTDGLAGVLYNTYVTAARYLQQRLHLRALSEQVYG